MNVADSNKNITREEIRWHLPADLITLQKVIQSILIHNKVKQAVLTVTSQSCPVYPDRQRHV